MMAMTNVTNRPWSFRAIAAIVVPFMMLLHADAQSFRVERIGDGRQSIVLIPGFACPGGVWLQTVDSLEKGYTCYVLTMPGFAGAAPEADPSFWKWAKEVADFIEREKMGKPIIVGHSMGGGLALHLATTRGERLKGIVVVDALPCLAAVLNPNFKSKAFTGRDFAEAEGRILNIPDSLFQRQAQLSAAALAATPSRTADLVAWSMASDRRTYARMYLDYTNVDMREEMKHIRVPGLVLLEQPFNPNRPLDRIWYFVFNSSPPCMPFVAHSSSVYSLT